MTAPQGLAPLAAAQLLGELRVVELSRGVAAAYCGRLLAQLGAQVTRFGPQTEAVASQQARPLLHAALHRGKTLAPLDGDALAAALAAADLVVVEQDARGDALDAAVRDIVDHRRGLQHAAMMVVLSANGFGVDAGAGCALTSAAWAGMSWAIGEPAREPLAPAYDIVDYQAGAHAAAAALATWVAGAGAMAGPLDVSSRDVAAHLVSTLAQNYVPFGRPWQRDGRRPFMSGGIYPLGLFECCDGLIALYCRSAEQWHGILRAMGDPDWGRQEHMRDPRVVARHHGDEADRHLLPWLARHSKAQLMAMGMEFGFPAAPVGTVLEALDNPQFAFRGSLEPLAAGQAVPVRVPAAPWLLYEAAPAAPAVRAWPVAHGAGAAPSALLRGLRVLDLSWVWSGPQVTCMLCDLGAEVIKVEHPSRLDSVRQRGRPFIDGKEAPGPVEELNPWFNQLNHGKRSLVLDIKDEADRARLLALAAQCDVVVENMRPGALDKLGLGYHDMAAANPAIVMLSMSLAGQQGPLSSMKGYAGIMTSMAGLESLVGYEEDDGRQCVVGMAKTAMGDPNAAIHAMAVLMAALDRRRRSGRGVWIDLSQTDAVLAMLAGPLIESQLHGQAPVLGNRHPLHAPHGHFACSKGGDWVAIAVLSQAHWHALVGVCGQAVLGAFADMGPAERVQGRREIEQALAGWTQTRSREQVVALLAAAGVPVAPVHSYQDMVAAPWRSGRALTRTIDHPYIVRQEIVAPPWRFGGASACAERGAPLLGADTEQVLRMLELPAPADLQDITKETTP